jgi:hypothetical protein
MATEQEIGTLVTKFVADLTSLQQGVAEYDKEMDKAAASTAKTTTATDQAKKSTGSLNTEMVNLAASLYNAQFIYNITTQELQKYIDKTVEAYDAVWAFHRMTGISVEQSGRWKEALEPIGLSLDSLTMSYRLFSNQMQSAQTGTGQAADAFRELHVNLKDANGQFKDSNTLMIETISALEKLPDGQQKNALAMDIFGRSYMNINKLLEHGVDVQKMLNEANSDGYSDKNLQAVKDYETATNKLNSTIDTLYRNVGEKLLPVFTNLTNFITNSFIPSMTNALDPLFKHIEYYGYMWKEIGQGKTIKDMFSFDEYFTQQKINTASEKQQTSETPTTPKKTTWADYTTSPTGSAGSSPPDDFLLSKGEVGIRAAGKEINPATGKPWLTQEEVTKYILAYHKIMEGRVATDMEELQILQNILNQQKRDNEDYAQTKKDIDNKVAETTIDVARTQNKTLIKEWDGVAKAIAANPANAKIIITTEYGSGGGGTTTPTSNTVWNGPVPAGEPAGGWAASTDYQLWMASAYASNTVTYQQAIEAWARGEWLPNVVSVFKHKALGGPVTAGMPYVVGESGPEIFAPDTNGTILPNMSTGGTANIYVELDGDIIAQKIAAPLVSEIRVRTGIR